MDENDQNEPVEGAPGMKIFGWVVALAALLAIAGTCFLFGKSGRETVNQPNTAKNTIPKTSPMSESKEFNFENPKKSAHYESNTPVHGAMLAGVPVNVVIDFNFDLAPPSAISIKMGGKEYGIGETMIDANKLAMRKNMDPASPDGLYDVVYNACWPDGSCHDGKFQFMVDRSLAGSFTDLRGQKEVFIKMKNISFSPKEIRISVGTKVTWIQEDDAEHFVNTQTHPAHTYFLAQNSRGLKLGDTFSVIFDRPGIYPYHCSAHASVMTGIILIE